MAITDYKVSEIYSGRDIASLSDRPNEDGVTASQLKARFDQLGKEVIPNYNDLIDFIETNLFAGGVTDGHSHNIDNIEDGTTNKLFTADDNTKLDGIEVGAEVNQNAFSNVKVGATTISASTKTDTFELVAGLNITLIVDSLTKKVSLSATGELASTAVQTLITDLGNYYTSLEVEGALQEVGLSLEAHEAFINTLKVTTKEPTGFTNNENIDVSYDSTTRKVTLTGTFEAYFNGVLIPELVTGWESPAHADVVGAYYLYYNGTSFVFDTTAWTFDMLMIASIAYGATHKFAIRETHGFMPNSVHQELHDTIGTYKNSGGDFSNVTLNSTTLKQPFISDTYIKDEDLITRLLALGTASYTQMYLSGSVVSTRALAQTQIVPQTTAQANYNLNTAGTWSQQPFGNNDYGAVFVIAVPVTSDIGSQSFRYQFIQPQQVSTNLAIIQALSPSSLNLGTESAVFQEYVFIGKIIIKASVSDWVIYSIEKLEGTKISKVAIPVSSGLSVVSTDATLTGDGTVTTPISVVNDGHTHDGRYYTETETDNLLDLKAPLSSPAFTGNQPTSNGDKLILNEEDDTNPIYKIRNITQVEYDALTPNANTAYFIVG